MVILNIRSVQHVIGEENSQKSHRGGVSSILEFSLDFVLWFAILIVQSAERLRETPQKRGFDFLQEGFQFFLYLVKKFLGHYINISF
jgi:hypothetical protein